MIITMMYTGKQCEVIVVRKEAKQEHLASLSGEDSGIPDGDNVETVKGLEVIYKLQSANCSSL